MKERIWTNYLLLSGILLLLSGICSVVIAFWLAIKYYEEFVHIAENAIHFGLYCVVLSLAVFAFGGYLKYLEAGNPKDED